MCLHDDFLIRTLVHRVVKPVPSTANHFPTLHGWFNGMSTNQGAKPDIDRYLVIHTALDGWFIGVSTNQGAKPDIHRYLLVHSGHLVEMSTKQEAKPDIDRYLVIHRPRRLVHRDVTNQEAKPDIDRTTTSPRCQSIKEQSQTLIVTWLYTSLHRHEVEANDIRVQIGQDHSVPHLDSM